jgi:hypothetical protein
MATYSQIKHDAEETLKILRRPYVQALMRKHPDADWTVQPANSYRGPCLHGEIHLGYVDAEDPSEDIRDCANGADNDSYVIRQELINKTQRGLHITLVLVAWQSYSEDEKATLRAIGKMQTITSQPYTYEAVVCQ